MNKWNSDLSRWHILLWLGWNREVTRNSVHTYTRSIHIYTYTHTHIYVTVSVNTSNQDRCSINGVGTNGHPYMGRDTNQILTSDLSYIKDLNDF